MKFLFAIAFIVFATQANACDEGELQRKLQQFVREQGPGYNLMFFEGTARNARKNEIALGILTDTYNEHFAKDASALNAIKECSADAISDAGLAAAKK